MIVLTVTLYVLPTHCSTLRSALYYLMEWVMFYLKCFEERRIEEGDDFDFTLIDHSVFYSVMQSVAYVMCFKGGRIADSEEGVKFMQQWTWETVIKHELDPLSNCLGTVAREFLQKTLDLSLLSEEVVDVELYRLNNPSFGSGLKRYVSNDSNQNASADLSTGGMGKGDNPLDSFFPFDPYLLYKSSNYIEKLYQTWNGTSGVSEFDDEWEEKESMELNYKVSPLIGSLVGSVTMSMSEEGSLPSIGMGTSTSDDFHQVVYGAAGLSNRRMSSASSSLEGLSEDSSMSNLLKFKRSSEECESGSW